MEGDSQDSHLLSFKKDLLHFISDNKSDVRINLIRKHDKNLTKGDFSFPSISNKNVWTSSRPGSDSVALEDLSSVFKVDKCQFTKDFCILYLDRKSVFDAYFCGQSNNGANSRNPTNVALVNFDLEKPNSSPLTSSRVALFLRCLLNFPLSNDTRLGISSTDLPTQLLTLQPSGEGVRVGPVLGVGGRKEEGRDLSDLTNQVRDVIEQLDIERCDESESLKDKEERLSTLTSSFITFTFLGGNISQPVKVDFTNQTSSFVLYNVARMTRLLSTFEEKVVEGTYPPLPDQVDFGLLKEPEEWELMFNFLLVFPDMKVECVRTRSLHKVVSFLGSLANTYSRYYNRVKTLKEPLASLVPVVHARVRLVREVKDVCHLALGLLNIVPLQNM